MVVNHSGSMSKSSHTIMKDEIKSNRYITYVLIGSQTSEQICSRKLEKYVCNHTHYKSVAKNMYLCTYVLGLILQRRKETIEDMLHFSTS